MDPATIDLFKTWVPITTSVIALGFSFLTLCWTIYRDAIRKPRFKVSIAIKRIYQMGRQPTDEFIALEALNFGPDANRVSSTYVRKNWLNRKIFDRANSRAFITPDHTHIAATQMGARVEVGDTATYVFPYNKETFLKENFVQVGVFDGFGRMHWAPRKELAALRRKYRKRFGDNHA